MLLILSFSNSSDRTKLQTSESDIEDLPMVGLEEMLDDLQIEDQEMNSDED